MITCPNCGKRNPDGNKFCGECGTDLSIAEMYCPNCGKMHNDGEKFCTECGTKLIPKYEYEILMKARIRKEREIRNDEIKELSESLDGASVMLLADELYSDYIWVNYSKEGILNNLLDYYSPYEIIMMSKNLPTSGEKYRVYKLFGELDEESARQFARHYLNIGYYEKMTKEEIFNYMLINFDMKKLRVKLMSYKSVYQ